MRLSIPVLKPAINFFKPKISYDDLLVKVKGTKRFSELNDKYPFLYLQPEEIAYPHSVLVFKDKEKYVIYQFTSVYSEEHVRIGEKKLGAGAFAVVKEAVDVSTGQLVAIKCCGTITDYLLTEKLNPGLELARKLKSEVIIKLHCNGLGSVAPTSVPSDNPYENINHFSVMAKGHDCLEHVKKFELTKQQKIQLLQDSILFCKLLYENSLCYYEFNAANFCVDENMRLKVCDLDTFERSDKPLMFIGYMQTMLYWVYESQLTDENTAAFEQVLEKLMALSKEYVKNLNPENLDKQIELLLAQCATFIEACEKVPSLKHAKPYSLQSHMVGIGEEKESHLVASFQ